MKRLSLLLCAFSLLAAPPLRADPETRPLLEPMPYTLSPFATDLPFFPSAIDPMSPTALTLSGEPELPPVEQVPPQPQTPGHAADLEALGAEHESAVKDDPA